MSRWRRALSAFGLGMVWTGVIHTPKASMTGNTIINPSSSAIVFTFRGNVSDIKIKDNTVLYLVTEPSKTKNLVSWQSLL